MFYVYAQVRGRRVGVGDKSKMLLKQMDTHHLDFVKIPSSDIREEWDVLSLPQKTELSSNPSPSGFPLGMPPASPLFCLFKLVDKMGKGI